MNETRKRSIVKALSWRLIAVICTWGVTWAVTGSFATGASVGLIDCLIKLFAYYSHERGWQRVPWGVSDDAAIASRGEGI